MLPVQLLVERPDRTKMPEVAKQRGTLEEPTRTRRRAVVKTVAGHRTIMSVDKSDRAPHLAPPRHSFPEEFDHLVHLVDIEAGRSEQGLRLLVVCHPLGALQESGPMRESVPLALLLERRIRNL